MNCEYCGTYIKDEREPCHKCGAPVIKKRAPITLINRNSSEDIDITAQLKTIGLYALGFTYFEKIDNISKFINTPKYCHRCGGKIILKKKKTETYKYGFVKSTGKRITSTIERHIYRCPSIDLFRNIKDYFCCDLHDEITIIKDENGTYFRGVTNKEAYDEGKSLFLSIEGYCF